MDHDRDGRLSFADFEISVKSENLLLESFGPCLPNTKYATKFLTARALEVYSKS